MFTITITITYDYIPLHYMIRKGGPPWVRHLSAPYWSLLGVSLVSLAATMQPHAPVPNVASSPWPIPLGEVGLCRFCKPDRGRGLKSVCSGNFTHVTHIVKLYMYIKYYRLRTLHIWNIANKTSHISCTLFHNFRSVANWPGLFWRRGEGARKVCQNPDICSFRVNTKRGYFV